jgi:polysaccharide export outer membrane protein
VTYYDSNDSKQAFSDAILVNPGDTVLVPTAEIVYVMGDVAKPGGYPIATNDSRLTVLQAITMAGSANKTAVQSHIRLIRTSEGAPVETSLRLDAIEKGKEPDLALKPNDIIYVPFSWMKNVVVSSSSIAATTAGAAVYAVH